MAASKRKDMTLLPMVALGTIENVLLRNR